MLRAILLIAAQHLRARVLRTLLTLAGVALGVAVSIAIRHANVDVLRSFEASVITVSGRATLQVSGGELGLDERIIERLRKHPRVTSATPVIQATARVRGGPHAGESVMILGLDLLEAGDLKGFRVTSAETDSGLDGLLSSDTLFLGDRLAKEWGVEAGSPLTLAMGTRDHQVMVRGMIEPAGAMSSMWSRMGVMDIAAVQARFDLVGRLDRIDLITEPGASIDGIARDIGAMLPPGVTVARPTRRNEQVERMVRAFQLNLAMLSAMGLLVGLFLVYNTVSFSVIQRRREIGMLNALGMPRRGISAVFLGEAAMIGAIGGVIGGWNGVLLARSLLSLVSRTISDLYVPIGPSDTGSTAGFWGLFSVPGSILLEGALLGMTVAMVGALGPSLDASRTAPVRALAPGDYEATHTTRAWSLVRVGMLFLAAAGLLSLPGPVAGVPLFGYAAALCLLTGLSCLAAPLLRVLGHQLSRSGAPRRLRSSRAGRLGALAQLAGEQLARAPGRNAVTISAMMVGIAIMVGVGTMIGSFRQTVQVWIDQTVMADLIVASTAWLEGNESGLLAKRIPLSWGDLVASIPGVAAVDTYRELTIELDGQPVALVSRDLRLHAERSRYLFVSGDSAETLKRTVASEGVVVSEVLARTHHLSAGGWLRLPTPSGEQAFRIHGVFYDYATDGGKIVMDRRLYRGLWQDETTTVLPVYVEEDADLEAVRRRIDEVIRGVASASHPAIISNRELKQEILSIFDRTFAVTYALQFIAVAIAALGIVNTLVTSVLERQRELATLRSIGASAAQIRGLVLCESMYLGIFGGLLGVAAGLLLSVLLIEVINKQSFGWTIRMTVSFGILAKAVLLASVAALVGGYLPARWAARQRIADGLRYE